MKRVGEFTSEHKRGVAAAAGLFAVIGGLAVITEPPEVAGRAVATPIERPVVPQPTRPKKPAPPVLNELGIPKDPCGWTPNNPQKPTRFVREDGQQGWKARIDGRCRTHKDGEIRAYSAPKDEEAHKLVNMDGGPMHLSPGQEVEVLCSQKGTEVANDLLAISAMWMQIKVPYGSSELPVWITTTDLGFVPGYQGGAMPAGSDVIPSCAKI